MNKKGIMLHFLLRLVLTIALVVTIVIIFSKCTRLSTQSKQNFYDFADEIKKIALDPKINKKIYPLIMDEETAIVGIKSNADAFKVNFLEKSLVSEEQYVTHFISDRAEHCEKDKACMCLCRKGLEIADTLPAELFCKELICKNFDKFDFSDTFQLPGDKIQWQNGFIILRTKEQLRYLTGTDVTFNERRREVSIAKEVKEGKIIITVCDIEDCI